MTTIVTIDPATDAEGQSGIAVARLFDDRVDVVHVETVKGWSHADVEAQAQWLAKLFGATGIVKEGNFSD